MVNDPPAPSARWRRFVSPLPVMSPWMPRPLSTTSMHKSSSTATLIASELASRVADGVAHRFSDNGFSVIGERRVDNRKRPHVLHGGAQLRAGELSNGLVEALA